MRNVGGRAGLQFPFEPPPAETLCVTRVLDAMYHDTEAMSRLLSGRTIGTRNLETVLKALGVSEGIPTCVDRLLRSSPGAMLMLKFCQKAIEVPGPRGSRRMPPGTGEGSPCLRAALRLRRMQGQLSLIPAARCKHGFRYAANMFLGSLATNGHERPRGAHTGK